MAGGQHTTQGTVPLGHWAQRVGITPAAARKLASRGLLDQFRPKGADGQVIPRSGLSDEEGATQFLRAYQQQLAARGGSTGHVAKATEGRRAAAQARRGARRQRTLEAAARAGVGELDRTHLDPGEDMQAAHDRRAQLEADRVELQVAEQRRVLCVREDLLRLVADQWTRLTRQMESIPRLVTDTIIVAVQGADTRIRREQREAVASVLEEAVEQRLRATQDEMERLFRSSGGGGS